MDNITGQDYLIRATAADGMIRAFAATTRQTVETARKTHDLSPVAAAALGRLLTAAQMMGSDMKGEKDLLTIRINCDGPIGGLLVTQMPGFEILGRVDTLAPSNPLHTTARMVTGGWLAHFGLYPWMTVAPILGFAGTLVAMIGIYRRQGALAFGGSSAGAAGIIATVGCAMFPFILPSSIDPHSSLTVWNASSSARTYAAPGIGQRAATSAPAATVSRAKGSATCKSASS